MSTGNSIREGLLREIERDSQLNIRRAPAAPVVDAPAEELVPFSEAREAVLDGVRIGREEAQNAAAFERAVAEHKRAGDELATQALKSVTNFDKPLVQAVGELITSGFRPQADALLAHLSEDVDHFEDAGVLQVALAHQEVEQSLAADAAAELARLAEASKAEAMAKAARADSDNAFLARNPNANIDMLLDAQERALVTQGLDLSLTEIAPRVKVAAVALENDRKRNAIVAEAWKSSPALQREHPDGPPVVDDRPAFRTAARVASVSEGERIKAAILKPELGDAQAELDKVREGAQARLAEEQRADFKRRRITT